MTHGWKHLLPYANRWDNLDRIARGLRSFDIVGLQEVDSGSLRTGFVNQIKYLADGANFPFWYHQVNRRLGKFAQHSNGLLSRLHPYERADHKLPGAARARRDGGRNLGWRANHLRSSSCIWPSAS